MCGIAGVINLKNTDRSQVLTKMLDRIVHRGPDSRGVYQNQEALLGMTRLSINDIEYGQQPFFSEDRKIVSVYNGEIYNFQSLKKNLEARGHQFKTKSDGEILPHLYEEFGTNLFKHLDGMFSVSIWDESQRKLILARDFPGEKPLYYTKNHDLFAFASELKALNPLGPFTISEEAIWDMPTFLWIPEPNTIYKEIKSLMPGEILVWQNGGMEIQSFRPKKELYPFLAGSQDLKQKIKDTLFHSIESRLLSDVQVGSFLSGGLDSSLIASISQKKLGNLKTFTIGFENLSDPYHGSADESADAQMFASLIGTKHHTIRVTDLEMREKLDEFVKFGDQPFSVSSGMGILLVAEAARAEGVKVLLSGDGADEAFGGYSWYSSIERILGLHQNEAEVPSLMIEDTFQSLGIELGAREEMLATYGGPELARALHYYATENEKRNLFSNEVFKSSRNSTRHFDLGSKLNAENIIAQDRNFYFPNEMLRKVDRMTMAKSIEGRAPFACAAVQYLADSINYGDMVRGTTLKYALREAASEILPPVVTNRPKHGFNVPIDHWLKGGWNELLRHTFSRESQLFKLGFIHEKSAEIALKALHHTKRLNGHTLFSFIVLNMWLEQTRND